MKFTTIVIIVFCLLINCFQLNSQNKNNTKKEKWVQLFNGENLDGWNVKITGHKLNDNYKNTFRVSNGVLQVNYDQYNGTFNNSFGHIFYKNEYSDYKMRLEYRFTGEQLKDMASWATRNSGVMIHCQAPETMHLNQKFPVSIEVQLLGGLNEGERSTANVCTPGTHIYLKDDLEKKHCIQSDSKTYHGNQWVQLEILVKNDSIISHKINGETVMTYYKPQLGGKVDFDVEYWKKKEGEPLKKGYISFQSESHPVEFRNIELLKIK